MKVYIISVETLKTGFRGISWEGYKTVEAAQAFIESRSDSPIKCGEMMYYSNEHRYRIHEIIIK